jgi:hypothetical protein
VAVGGEDEDVSADDLIYAIMNRKAVNILYRDFKDQPPSKRYILPTVYGQLFNGNYAIRAQQISGASKKGNKYASTKIFRKKTDDGAGMVLLKLTPYIEVNKTKDEEDDFNDTSVSTYSNISLDGYELLRADLLKILKKKSKRDNNISLIVQTRHGYDTQTFDLPKQKLDLEHNYGSSFAPVHDKILSTLNQKKGKGLVLLHGEPGTGKTHYLKYLASKIKDKKVMFVPPYLVDFITSPEMTPFLIENSDSILFIEDAERVITDRDASGANGVSNILNFL